MRATVPDCVIRIPGPQTTLSPAHDRSALASTMREFCRYGVERFTLLMPADGSTPPTPEDAGGAAGTMPDAAGLGRSLPKPVRIDVRPVGAERLPERYLLCDAGAKLPVNLGVVLRQAAARPDVPVHRLLLRDAGGIIDSTIRLVRGSTGDAPGDAVGNAAGDIADVLGETGHARRALLLDRDGVLNIDHGYVGSADRFEWTEDALAAIRAASDAGWQVFIVTNQSGVARGLYGEQAVRDLLDWIADEARRAGGTVDDSRYCPYHPEAAVAAYRQDHPWRKPAPGMLLDVMRTWGIDAAQAVMIGDQQTDMQAAAAAGIEGHLFAGGSLLAFLQPILRRPVGIARPGSPGPVRPIGLNPAGLNPGGLDPVGFAQSDED